MSDSTTPEKLPRKVIQITAASETNPLCALCDDGTMWVFSKPIGMWSRVPDIPQDDGKPSA